MALYGINTGLKRKGLLNDGELTQPDDTLAPQPAYTGSLLLPDLLKEQPIENEPDFMTEPTDFGISPTQYNAPAEFGAASPEKTGMYWKQPVAGNMPLDRFVQMMGIGANALAPNEASGRMGAGLAQMAAQGGREEGALAERNIDRKRQDDFRKEQAVIKEKQLKEHGDFLRVNRLYDIAKTSKNPAILASVYQKIGDDWETRFGQKLNLEPGTKSDTFFKDISDWKRYAQENKLSPKETYDGILKIGVDAGVTTPQEFIAAQKPDKEKPESITPHTTIETSPDGTKERTVLWDATNKAYAPMQGAAGEWHKVKSQVVNINNAAKDAEGFKTWTPEAKNQAFMYNLITREPPVSTRGMGAGDRQAYAKAYSQWQVDRGLKPSDIALMQSDYRAGDMSLKNMSKQEAPMSAFVGNINKQIDKITQLYKSGDRTGLRLLDLPIRELRVRAKGSGDEAVKASYLLEVSNEIGKLSSGSSASVQQLSDSAKEDWKKVHDPNLSLSEITKVLNATREQANMRMSSWREAKQEVRKMLGDLGTADTTGGGKATHRYVPGKGIVEIQ